MRADAEGSKPVSERSNLRLLVLGVLVLSLLSTLVARAFYLQVLEGGRTAVSQLLGNLYKDPRHTDLVVLEFDYIHQRQFPQWTMQFIPVGEVTREVLLRHGVSSTFDPYSFTKGSALAFMLEMVARQQARAA